VVALLPQNLDMLEQTARFGIESRGLRGTRPSVYLSNEALGNERVKFRFNPTKLLLSGNEDFLRALFFRIDDEMAGQAKDAKPRLDDTAGHLNVLETRAEIAHEGPGSPEG
jgi:hypothetical protein